VVEECRGLLDRGIHELCLVGQDLGSYGKDRGEEFFKGEFFEKGRSRLDTLFAAVSELPGSFWVRLLYIHPDNFPFQILEFFTRDSRFLPYFDLPFQHASAPLLAAMNRGGSKETYLRLIDHIRAALPDAVIRSTFLVGFPGETEEDFAELLDFQQKAALDWLGVFSYSREEDTPAYTMKNRVPKKIAAERQRIVEAAQLPLSGERMNRFIGRTLDVLVEEELSAPFSAAEAPRGAPAGGGASLGGSGEGLYLGRLFCQAPEIDGVTVITSDTALVPGSIVRGAVIRRAGIDLEVRV
jgi:ribosomal protein S12 methylthiotransferase